MAFRNFIRALILLIYVMAQLGEQSNASFGSNDTGKTVTRILKTLFDSEYDKTVRPNYADKPVEVAVSIHIISLSLSESRMDFTTNFYFRQKWNDNRLAYAPESGINELRVGSEVTDKIWIPDTFFSNELIASSQYCTTPYTYIRIYSSGDVQRSIRFTLTASCPMNLKYFPMDRQICTIELESYGYSMTDIIYEWANGSEWATVGLSNLELPQFRVIDLKALTRIERLTSGNHSRLVCEIHFARALGYYLMQIYIPSSLIVVMSWIAFWLNRKATGARVTLGVTTVLTITTLLSTTNSTLPKISYIKAIDVFLETCFVMVFASFMESAAVGYYDAKVEKSLSVKPVKQKPESSDYTYLNGKNNLPNDTQEKIELMTTDTKKNCNQLFSDCGSKVSQLSIGEQSETMSTLQNMSLFNCTTIPNNLFETDPSIIDKYCRVVFPVCFACFNIMYWVIYLHVADEVEA